MLNLPPNTYGDPLRPPDRSQVEGHQLASLALAITSEVAWKEHNFQGRKARDKYSNIGESTIRAIETSPFFSITREYLAEWRDAFLSLNSGSPYEKRLQRGDVAAMSELAGLVVRSGGFDHFHQAPNEIHKLVVDVSDSVAKVMRERMLSPESPHRELAAAFLTLYLSAFQALARLELGESGQKSACHIDYAIQYARIVALNIAAATMVEFFAQRFEVGSKICWRLSEYLAGFSRNRTKIPAGDDFLIAANAADSLNPTRLARIVPEIIGFGCQIFNYGREWNVLPNSPDGRKIFSHAECLSYAPASSVSFVQREGLLTYYHAVNPAAGLLHFCYRTDSDSDKWAATVTKGCTLWDSSESALTLEGTRGYFIGSDGKLFIGLPDLFACSLDRLRPNLGSYLAGSFGREYAGFVDRLKNHLYLFEIGSPSSIIFVDDENVVVVADPRALVDLGFRSSAFLPGDELTDLLKHYHLKAEIDVAATRIKLNHSPPAPNPESPAEPIDTFYALIGEKLSWEKYERILELAGVTYRYGKGSERVYNYKNGDGHTIPWVIQKRVYRDARPNFRAHVRQCVLHLGIPPEKLLAAAKEVLG